MLIFVAETKCVYLQLKIPLSDAAHCQCVLLDEIYRQNHQQQHLWWAGICSWLSVSILLSVQLSSKQTTLRCFYIRNKLFDAYDVYFTWTVFVTLHDWSSFRTIQIQCNTVHTRRTISYSTITTINMKLSVMIFQGKHCIPNYKERIRS